MNLRDAKRIDIISDTHGHLSDALLGALEGADLIIHAGDITSEADYHELATIAPLRAVLGNPGISDTELCFRALYAAMLYRIKGEGGKSAVSDTIEYISPVVAELAEMHRKAETGEIDLFKDGKEEKNR